jgi:hypothetical protein
MTKAKNEWVREGLQRRGYRQKDVAVAWASQQATVSRFIAGEELQDLQLSKALSLSKMLGITVEELAKGLGLSGVAIEPTIPGGEPQSIPLGTMNMSSPRPGVTRLEMRKDFSVKAAQDIIGIMSTDTLPS